MIGNNIFQLNKATVIAALQQYFRDTVFDRDHAPVVTDVRANGPDGFFVEVTDKKEQQT